MSRGYALRKSAAVEAQILARVPITFVPSTARRSTRRSWSARSEASRRGFVLDTGSEVHILTKELVDALGLDVEQGEEGVDHSGATMPSWSVEDVSLSLVDDRR